MPVWALPASGKNVLPAPLAIDVVNLAASHQVLQPGKVGGDGSSLSAMDRCDGRASVRGVRAPRTPLQRLRANAAQEQLLSFVAKEWIDSVAGEV